MRWPICDRIKRGRWIFHLCGNIIIAYHDERHHWISRGIVHWMAHWTEIWTAHRTMFQTALRTAHIIDSQTVYGSASIHSNGINSIKQPTSIQTSDLLQAIDCVNFILLNTLRTKTDECFSSYFVLRSVSWMQHQYWFFIFISKILIDHLNLQCLEHWLCARNSGYDPKTNTSVLHS